MLNHEYVFENNKNPRKYTFDAVRFIFKKYRQPDKLIGGELKEKLFSELLGKPKLRKGLVFRGEKQAFQLVDFGYSHYMKGVWSPVETLTIEVEYSRIHTEKMQKEQSKNEAL